MKKVLDFPGGYCAVIAHDPELEMCRGEFIDLNGGADFYEVTATSRGKTSASFPRRRESSAFS